MNFRAGELAELEISLGQRITHPNVVRTLASQVIPDGGSPATTTTGGDAAAYSSEAGGCLDGLGSSAVHDSYFASPARGWFRCALELRTSRGTSRGRISHQVPVIRA